MYGKWGINVTLYIVEFFASIASAKYFCMSGHLGGLYPLLIDTPSRE